MTNPTARSNAAIRHRRCGSIIGVAASLVLLAAAPVLARANLPVPLPKPRPASAPRAEQRLAPDQSTAAAPEAPTPSACRQSLTEEIALAPSLPQIHGPGNCGGDDIVKLEAVVLPNKSHVTIKPAATLRCPMAAAVADWVRTDLAALASSLNTTVSEIDNFDSYDCRGRNGVAGAQLSEHGKANALDVRLLKFSDGSELRLTDRTADRGSRESVLHSACARFSTVLGPDSDWYHEDHIHLDLAERHNNYRICEWDVLDPLPAVAPLLPAARPAEAPPREAGADDKPNPSADAAKSGVAPNGAQAKPDAHPSVPEPSARRTSAKNKERRNPAPL
jgi:hypothetical protein